MFVIYLLENDTYVKSLIRTFKAKTYYISNYSKTVAIKYFLDEIIEPSISSYLNSLVYFSIRTRLKTRMMQEMV